MLRKTILISILITSTLLFYVSCHSSKKLPPQPAAGNQKSVTNLAI